MQIGIIGLQTSGKTTIFNALTHGHAETSAGGGEKDANRGVAHVPDERIDFLVNIHHPKKTTYASVEFTDVAGLAKGSGKEKGFSSRFLGDLRDMEALLIAVRIFKSDSVPHPEGAVDPARDLDAVMTELILADMAVIEKRLPRIGESWKKQVDKRKELNKEKESLQRFLEALNNDQPIISIDPTPGEIQLYIRPYGLLSGKQMLCAANVSDLTDKDEQDALAQLQDAADRWKMPVIPINAQLEHDLLEFPPEEWDVYYQESGLDGPARGKIIQESYRILKQHSFLTCGPDEVRAWTIPVGMKAQQAAGKIHSDIERGFIRAEVIAFQDWKQYGSEDEVKKAGKFRLEGKEYIVQDGDVINFRFSV